MKRVYFGSVQHADEERRQRVLETVEVDVLRFVANAALAWRTTIGGEIEA